jgi:hypothetical protein
MAILCDTATVSVRDGVELWVEAVSQLFVPLECVPHHGAAFHGRLRAGRLGPLRMCGMEVSPHTVKRTRLAANTQGDQYKLSLSSVARCSSSGRPGGGTAPKRLRHLRLLAPIRSSPTTVRDARLRAAAGPHRIFADRI